MPPREKCSVVYTGARILTNLFSVLARARIVCSWCLAARGCPKTIVPCSMTTSTTTHRSPPPPSFLNLYLTPPPSIYDRVRISPACHRPQTTAARTGGRWPWNTKYIIVIIIIIFNNINDERDFERRNGCRSARRSGAVIISYIIIMCS